MIGLIRNGWTAFWVNRSLWLFLYLAKLGLALVITIPVLVTVKSALDTTLYSSPLLKEWSLKVIGELIAQRPFVLGNVIVVLVIFTLVVLLARQFLNGGIYRAYSSGRTLSSREFFTDAGSRLGVHLRITGLMVIIYLVLFGVGLWIASIVGRIVSFALPESGGAAFAVWLGVTGLVMIPGVAFSDTIRAASVRADAVTLRPLILDAFSFFKAHWVQLVGAYLLLFVPFVMIWAIVEKSALLVTGGLENKIGVIVELLLFQICSLLRTGQSLLFTASVTAGYRPPVRTESVSNLAEVPGD